MDEEDQEPFQELARRLCAAYVSYTMGITIAYALKTYVQKDKPIGSYWLALANQVAREQSEGMSRVIFGQSPEKSPS